MMSSCLPYMHAHIFDHPLLPPSLIQHACWNEVTLNMENYEWECCIVALSNIWNVFARFVKRRSKKFTSILIENSVVFALAIYWSTQQRASLALCSGIPIPNSKKWVSTRHHTQGAFVLIWNRRTNATVIWYFLCFLAFIWELLIVQCLHGWKMALQKMTF